MATLRRFLTLCLILMLLPWGAWLRAAEAGTAPQPLPTPAIEAPQVARAEAQPRPCRTAILPGSVCTLAIQDEDLALPSAPDGSTAAATGTDALTPAEWDGPVAIPPPRLN